VEAGEKSKLGNKMEFLGALNCIVTDISIDKAKAGFVMPGYFRVFACMWQEGALLFLYNDIKKTID